MAEPKSPAERITARRDALLQQESQLVASIAEMQGRLHSMRAQIQAYNESIEEIAAGGERPRTGAPRDQGRRNVRAEVRDFVNNKSRDGATVPEIATSLKIKTRQANAAVKYWSGARRGEVIVSRAGRWYAAEVAPAASGRRRAAGD
jgi:hypothetical protein